LFLLCRPRFKFGQQLKQFKDGILERTRTKRNKTDTSNDPTKDLLLCDSMEIEKPITMERLEKEEESPGHESCGSAGSDSLYDLSLETIQHHVIPNPKAMENSQIEPDFEKVPTSLGGDSQISQSDSNASSLVFKNLIVDTDDSNDDADSSPVSPKIIFNNSDSNLETNLYLKQAVPLQRNLSPKVDDYHQTENLMISSASSPCLKANTDQPKKRKPVTLPRKRSLKLTAATTGVDSDSVDSPLFSRDISRNNHPQTMPRKIYQHVTENGALSKPKIVKEKPPIIPRKSSGTLEGLGDAELPVPKPRVKKLQKLNSIKKPSLDKETSKDVVDQADAITLLPTDKLNTNEASVSTHSPKGSPLIERKALSVGAIRKHQLLRPMSSCSVDARLPTRSSLITKSVSSEELNDEEKLTLTVAPAIEMAPFEGDESFRDRFVKKSRRSKTLKATTRLSEMRKRSQLIEVKGTSHTPVLLCISGMCSLSRFTISVFCFTSIGVHQKFKTFPITFSKRTQCFST